MNDSVYFVESMFVAFQAVWAVMREYGFDAIVLVSFFGPLAIGAFWMFISRV